MFEWQLLPLSLYKGLGLLVTLQDSLWVAFDNVEYSTKNKLEKHRHDLVGASSLNTMSYSLKESSHAVTISS